MRKIIHVDMDAFFAAVEQRNNPALRGKPVVVGGRPDSRGVVSTCSYEARKFGIHSAMPSAEAHRRCPHAVFIVETNFDEYRRVSAQVHQVFHEVTDMVESMSLDEAYLDVSNNKRGEPSATRLAQWIRQRIFATTRLTASAGVSYNKSLAKIASDWKKPDGLTVITPEQALTFLEDLPVRKFGGVGPVTAAKMGKMGIHTSGDLRRLPLWKLSASFGKSGSWLYNLCRGVDHRAVVVEYPRKSLGKERTFAEDLKDVDRLEGLLHGIAASVWEDLKDGGLEGRTVTVKVKYADFHQVTKRRSFFRPPADLEDLCRIAGELLRETEAGIRPVRLLGVSVSNFKTEKEEGEARQLEFNFPEG